MSDLPPLVPETSSTSASSHTRNHDFSPRCPFCAIAKTYGPASPTSDASVVSEQLDPEQLEPPSYVLYSGEHVVAFLDIMPLTRGHVLVAPRKHRVKVGDLSPEEGAQIGRVLPLLARSVLKAVLPDIPHEQADYNIVQNNGPGAAQVVNHVHFHIVPRPPLNYEYIYPNTTPSTKRKYPPNKPPAGRQATAIQFGRGMREDLDFDEAAELVVQMREVVRQEWTATFGESQETGGKLRMESGGRVNEAEHGRRGAWKV